ncbi:hypothetical protein RRG08_056741 [Elysia crispata]|uniref:Uncharacterized protein n=1 Tax=Elysia crispata TaxID=231223 RepID=A0AAE1DKD8_9GAST|nr:hypothetical protein RRG08_056741 [Elysia crispata]
MADDNYQDAEKHDNRRKRQVFLTTSQDLHNICQDFSSSEHDDSDGDPSYCETGCMDVSDASDEEAPTYQTAHSHQGQWDQDPSTSKAPGTDNIDENLAISENLITALEKHHNAKQPALTDGTGTHTASPSGDDPGIGLEAKKGTRKRKRNEAE